MQVSASDPSTTAIVWISPQVYAMLARRHMLQLMPFHFKCIRFVSSRSFPLQLITKSKKNTTKTRKNHTRITSSSYFSCQTLASCLEGLVLGASFSVRHWHAKNSLVTSRANGAEVRYRSSLGVPCSGMAFRLLRSRASCGRTVP